MMESSLYMSGCDACLSASVQALDRHYGWELTVGFGYDLTREWTVREILRPSMDRECSRPAWRCSRAPALGYDQVSKTFTHRPWGLV